MRQQAKPFVVEFRNGRRARLTQRSMTPVLSLADVIARSSATISTARQRAEALFVQNSKPNVG